MNEARRCIYNAVRDRATGHNGVACFTSYDELGDVCQTNRRQAMALTNELVNDQLLIRASARTTVRRCYIPLDPDKDRNEAFFAAVAEGGFGVAVMARATFLATQGMLIGDICTVMQTSQTPCQRIMAFLNALFAHGYWRK